MPSFYEFFAGGGMMRAGLGASWACAFANDFDHKKCGTYRTNWGGDALMCGDVREVRTHDLPGRADLAWASFPCQDLSLAGAGAGLKGERSGTFWPFWGLLKNLVEEQRAPKIVALENVCGTLTSHKGQDFHAICNSFLGTGYRVGAMVIDAAHFVPQSRPRLFVVGVASDIPIPVHIRAEGPNELWHPKSLVGGYEQLPAYLKTNWIWWGMPTPPKRNTSFADLIEEAPTDVAWHTPAETKKLLDIMSTVNLEKVEAAKVAGRRMVGAIYKRTRRDEFQRKVQRAEIRFDDVAGCLRTPAGGSSRQSIMVVDGDKVRSRLISARETARLMGLADDYDLPENYNEAYHLTGDGVVVPAVSYLAANVIEPIVQSSKGSLAVAA